MSDHRERACTKCGSLLHHEDNCLRYCQFCGDPLGVDGTCDCDREHYLSEATISYLDFDAAICALHDNEVEKELSKRVESPFNEG